MEFARPLEHYESVATRSRIRRIELPNPKETDSSKNLDDQLVAAANRAAADRLGEDSAEGGLFPDRMLPHAVGDKIQAGQLVVIFESFDNLNFCYATPGEIFSNRNGHFHHDDFIGRPFGCKIRSRSHQGYGFCYLLKATPELWARSLPHRTQIVHELDASMIVFQMHLRPNMVVVESGTGSGALSHAILRTIAPHGHLYTYEFHRHRALAARQEFAKNQVGHLVTVTHKDVCGKQQQGGFDRPRASADAVVLDLPEPWLAIPHAAHCLKPNSRIASYSPCMEQVQRAVSALEENGFHSIKTLEFRLREHYVDEVKYDAPPNEKRPRLPTWEGPTPPPASTEREEEDLRNSENEKEKSHEDETDKEEKSRPLVEVESDTKSKRKRNTLLVTRPFATMRGHTAFLTFATAGNTSRPDPNQSPTDIS